MMTTSTTDRFSAHYSEWLHYNCVDFYSQILSRNFDTGWILCHISVVFFLILFKPHKRHSYYVYSIYTPSFNSFLESGLPCRHNNIVLREELVATLEIYTGFALKLLRRFLLMRPFCVPSFSLILACVPILSVRKDEE